MIYGTAPLLFAAVAGYWVLERAEKHRGGLRRAGQLLGGVIILVSLIGIACRVWSVATCRPFGASQGYCPMSSFKSSEAPTQTP